MRIVQKLNLKPLEERIAAMEGAGYNTFLLQNADVFLGGCRGGSPTTGLQLPLFLSHHLFMNAMLCRYAD